MAHHVPAVLPPIILPTPKLEKLRWRPRLRRDGTGGAAGDEAGTPAEIDDVYAPALVQADEARRSAASQQPGAAGTPFWPGSVTARTLTDDTLRTLLTGQEGLGLQEELPDRPG